MATSSKAKPSYLSFSSKNKNKKKRPNQSFLARFKSLNTISKVGVLRRERR